MTDLPEPARLMERLDEALYDERCGHLAFHHEGVAFTPDMTRAGLASIDALALDPRDVAVVGFPKSGTNWVTIVLSRLYSDWACLTETGGRVPDLHVPDRPQIGFIGFEHAVSGGSPRLMKSHAQFRHMPRAFREDRIGKAIYVTRNPKDVCDSYLNQLAGWYPDGRDWDVHVRAFIAGDVFFGSWLDNVTGWHAKGLEDNVLHLSYEAMRRDPRSAIEAIVGFVGVVGPGVVERVLGETAFEAMQSGELCKLYQPQMVRRKGKTGGWRARFTPEQSAAMDAAFAPALEAAGVPIDYGD